MSTCACACVCVCACARTKARENIYGQLIHRILKLTVLHANADVNTQPQRRRWWAPTSFRLRLPPQAADWLNKPKMIFCVRLCVEACKSHLVSPLNPILFLQAVSRSQEGKLFEGAASNSYSDRICPSWLYWSCLIELHNLKRKTGQISRIRHI